MPKHKTSQRHKARHIATLFDKEFKIDCDGKLFCTYCGVIVNCTKKYYVENHRKTKKHQNLMKSKTKQLIIDQNNLCTKKVLFIPLS